VTGERIEHAVTGGLRPHEPMVREGTEMLSIRNPVQWGVAQVKLAAEAVEEAGQAVRRAQAGCIVEEIPGEEELCRRGAAAIADGAVLGWFQGRMEWGPRALGNRSILCDPRRADMKAILKICGKVYLSTPRLRIHRWRFVSTFCRGGDHRIDDNLLYPQRLQTSAPRACWHCRW
jgi:hypothetical protein